MGAIWHGTFLEFLVPASSKHAVVLFTHTKGRKMFFTVKQVGGGTITSFANCSGDSANPFKSHDYLVLSAGQSYQISVRFDSFDCSNAGTPTQVPIPGVPFGGNDADGNSVEQWRFVDTAVPPVALCGITIIVIDDIVGPNGGNR